MFLNHLFTRITDPDDHAAGITLLRGMLQAPAGLYGAAVRFRNHGYTHGWLHSEQLPVRVISIGGITVGGGGKTPFVRHLARRLAEEGLRVAILSRGYGRRGAGCAIVSDESGVHLSWADAGDEPYLLASTLPGVPVIVGADRVAAGRLTIREFNPAVILLDDAFQHRRLKRDFDIVVLDSVHPDGNGRLLPAGTLREPWCALRRAQMIVLTRVDQSLSVETVRKRIRQIQVDTPIIECAYRPFWYRHLSNGETRPLDQLEGRRVIALSGIANPRSFERTVEHAGATIVRSLTYPDHYPFRRADIHLANQAVVQTRADWIVTTEKDAIRIPGDSDRSRILSLEIKVQIIRGEESLNKLILDFEF